MSKNSKVDLNIDELKQFLIHTVNNNKFLQEQGKTPLAVCVEGPAGIGKTSAILQVAKSLGIQCEKINLAEIEEISDLVGFPLRQFQLCKTAITKLVSKQVLKDGKMVMEQVPEVSGTSECLWVDEHAIPEYTKQGFSFTGNKRMSYCPPEWIAGKEDNGFFVLDDFTRGDPRFIQATMTLIDKQEYISWKLPKGWSIILSTNPDDGNYQVTAMDVAQLTRFSTVNLKFDIDCWMRYAEEFGVDGRCINFLALNKELVTEKCNPRAITNFFNSISSFTSFESNLPMIQLLGEGSVGPEFATMFTMFINNKLDKLISPKDILFHESDVHVTNALKKSIGQDGDYRADIASILVTRMINTAILFAETNTVDQKLLDRLIKLSTDSDVFTDDLKYVLIKKVVNGNKQKYQKLMTNAAVLKMSVK